MKLDITQTLTFPLTADAAEAIVRASEDAWNTRTPEIVAQLHTTDCRWRNRDEFLVGRDGIVEFLRRKWSEEIHYHQKKTLWAYSDNRIAVHFESEWQCAKGGQWFHTYGNEHWEMAENGLIQRRDMSANDISITADTRTISCNMYSCPMAQT